MAQSIDAKRKSFDQNIKVIVRIRPLTEEEKLKKIKNIVHFPSPKQIQIKEKVYNYDGVFTTASSQYDVYSSVVGPMIHDVIQGYNCTVFAYGQTGSGKTFTMIGGGNINNPNLDWKRDELTGCIPRAAAHIFDELAAMHVKEYNVKVSFLELYNEEVRDLLNDEDNNPQLTIFNDNKGSVYIQNLTEQTVADSNDIYKLLHKGTLRRQTAPTSMNQQSSRSHTVFTITVNTRESTLDNVEILKSGKLYLVDLAGSENIGKSGAKDKRAQETANINRSLLTLGRIIQILADKNAKYVPYRDSKLTRILRDSLGGHSKTSIIATISPAHTNHDETVSTLDYAMRARDIKNTPMINEKVSKAEMMLEMNKEIEKLRKDLDVARSGQGFYVSKQSWEELQTQLSSNTKMMSSKTEIIQELKEKLTVAETLRDIKEKQYEDAIQACKQREKKIINKARSHLKQERFVSECYFETVTEKNVQTQELLDITNSLRHDQEVLQNKLENQYYTNCVNVNMVKEKSSVLDTNLNSVLSIVNQTQSDCRRRMADLENKSEEVASDLRASVQASTQEIKRRIQTDGLRIHAKSEMIETAMNTNVVANIGRILTETKEVKSLSGELTNSQRSRINQFNRYNDMLSANTVSAVGNISDQFAAHLKKLKEEKLSLLGDLKRFTMVTENDLTVINSLLDLTETMKNMCPDIVKSEQLVKERNTFEEKLSRDLEKQNAITRKIGIGVELLEDLQIECEKVSGLMSDAKNNSEELSKVIEFAENIEKQFEIDVKQNFESLMTDTRKSSKQVDEQLFEADKLLRDCMQVRLNLENKLVPVVRAGDTPVVKPIAYPKRLGEGAPHRYDLIKKFKEEFSEDIENQSIDLDLSLDASIMPLDGVNGND